MAYCTTCGNQVAPAARFCPKCGSPVDTPAQPIAPAPAQPAVAVPLQTAPPPQPPAPPAKGKGLSVLLIVLAVLALIVMVAVGGIVYVGYKVKQKVSSVAQAVTHPAPGPGGNKEGGPAQLDLNKLGGLLGGLTAASPTKGVDDGDQVPSMKASDPVAPCSATPLPAQSSARIPLQPGTAITIAWGVKYGDVESRATIRETDSTSVAFTSATDARKDDDGQQAKAVSSDHIVCNEDFATADTYTTITGGGVPRLIHGWTRLRLSSKSFGEVKSSGKTNFVYSSFWSQQRPDYQGGILTRVEPQDVSYPMIVNDQRVNLPAIHLAGVMESVGKDPRPRKDRPSHSPADVYVIDDPIDPLVLMLKIQDPVFHDGKFRLEVVKIDYKTAQPQNTVEKQLSEQKRAVTYGIYFDFNKDTIKPESEPVLKEIVQAMTDNPDWKLTVEGHTDNIGGDAYNLDLSKRRAAAVKEALVTRYQMAPERLSTDGFGASRPVETNDTLEGRARNRRVELTRQ